MKTIDWKTSRRTVTACQAVFAAVIVATVALLLVHQRPTEYEARMSLIASPAAAAVQQPDNQSAPPAAPGDFGSVVSLGFPAISPLARTPQVLAAAHDRVPGSPPANELSSSISVELMPATALARISVRAQSPEIASGLVSAIADQLVQSNLLAPVAVLRPLDVQPEVTQINPDSLLSLGFALTAGALAAVAVVTCRALLLPNVGQRVTRALTAAGVQHDVAAFSLWDIDIYDRIGLLARAADTPVRVLATEPGVQEDVDKLTAGLAERGVRVRDERDGDGPTACLCMVRSSKDMAMLSVTVSALRDQYRLVGVITA